MKVYLAAPYEKKEIVKELVKNIEAETEHIVVSSWQEQPDKVPDTQLASCAKRDLDDIKRADILISLNLYESKTGGMHFECGYAHAMGIPVFYYYDWDTQLHIFTNLLNTDMSVVYVDIAKVIRKTLKSIVVEVSYTQKALDAITSILDSRKPEGNEFEVFDNCSVGHSELVMNQIAMKLARIKCNKSVQDSLLDIAGYALLEYAMNERDIDAGKFPS